LTSSRPQQRAQGDISRLTDGKIAETWHQEDIAGLMQQLTQPAA
jgi:hypothetical protein